MMLVILLVVFVSIIGIVVGTYLFVNRRRLAAAESALAQLGRTDRPQVTDARTILKDNSVSTLPALNRILSGREVSEELTMQLQRAGWTAMKPGDFLLRTAVSAVMGVVLGRFVASTLGGLVGFVLGAVVPFYLLRRAQAKRAAKFQEQLPDAIDMLVNAMRAGYSFQAAMKFIGGEMGDPLGTEFGRFYDEQRLGVEVRTALLGMQDRMDSLDLKMLITAILIQRESGGNLSEVLSNISAIMRDRARIQGEIVTLTAESKMAAKIVSAMPVVVFFAISFVNESYMAEMTASAMGWALLGVAAFIVTLGYFMMMKIAQIDI